MPNDAETYMPLSMVRSIFDACCSACQRRVSAKLLTFQARPLPTPLGPLHQLLHHIARDHQTPVEEVTRRGNAPAMVAIRREVAKKAREQGYSLPRIGMLLNRHHTTILQLLKT